ncbi:hydrolase [Lactiplantibacillus plantarum]|nr:hydrolase [Lactiplantibacillus plantarum]UZM82346.1 hydrolase [Lactiplantibacillus argentoratensis]AOG33282.1 hydrolase [Lactiplantibacillus plantarum]MCC6114094.1 hydrolase [Lactiplantibacillus plantarum]MCC6120293.1 hydrolase [Lactiplantibacillus plantarum]MCW6130717.1 hydrolase [Lactiplantibacillus plantarum]
MRRIIAIGKAPVTAGWLITIILVGYGVSRQLKRTLFE